MSEIEQTAGDPAPEAVEPALEVEPEAVAEPVADVEPVVEVEPEPVAEVEPEPVAEVEPDPAAEVEPEPAAEVEPVAEVEPEPVTEPVVEPEPVIEPVAEIEPEPAAEVEPVAEVEPEPEAEPVAEIEPESVVEVEPAIEAEPVTEGEPAAEIEPEAEPVSEIETGTEVQPEPEAAPASTEDAAAALAVRTSIVEEAESLAVSTEWTKASNAYRDLLDRWKAAGSAGRDADNALWIRFAGARDGFYQARNTHHAERAKLSAAAAERKRELIAETETLLDKTDARAIGDGLDRMLEEWKAAGRAGGEDQTLWLAFRAARDRAFTLRREIVAVRQRNRGVAKAAKEAMIEAAAATPKELEIDALQAAMDEQMAQWKKVGSAGREADEELWQRFRDARGPGFSRLRQVQQRAEREAATVARSAEDAAAAAERLGFSDSKVSDADVTRLERQFERGAASADPEVKAKFDEALVRVKERAVETANAVPATNPLAVARIRQEQTIRDLEARLASAIAAREKREIARVTRRIEDERAKLERMSAFIGG
jgi:hypothetical protein